MNATTTHQGLTPIETGRRGLMLILSSPSGAGKTTLTRMLLQDKSIDLTLSVSSTTRERRSSEVDGIHYHFIPRDQFDRMRGGDLGHQRADVTAGLGRQRLRLALFLHGGGDGGAEPQLRRFLEPQPRMDYRAHGTR